MSRRLSWEERIAKLKVTNVGSYRKILQERLAAKAKYSQLLSVGSGNIKQEKTVQNGSTDEDSTLPCSSTSNGSTVVNKKKSKNRKKNGTESPSSDVHSSDDLAVDASEGPVGDVKCSPERKIPRLEEEAIYSPSTSASCSPFPSDSGEMLDLQPTGDDTVQQKQLSFDEFGIKTSRNLEPGASARVEEVTKPQQHQKSKNLKRQEVSKGVTLNKRELTASVTTKQFGHLELVGHSDIIFDVSTANDLIASASRDSLVKVWSLSSGCLESTLSGHTEAVNCVLILSRADTEAWINIFNLNPDTSQLVISGGQDSRIRVWEGLTARELSEIYTFTPVVCVTLLNNQLGVVAIGTSSGKLETWELREKRQIESRSDFNSSVTSIKSMKVKNDGSVRLIASSDEGDVKVFDWSREAGLRLLYVSDTVRRKAPVHSTSRHAGSRSPSGTTNIVRFHQIRTLDFIDPDTILIGDSGSNLKLLYWRQNEVSKLGAYPGEVCVVDALAVAKGDMSGLVLSAGVCLDTNDGFVSVFDSIVRTGGSNGSLQHRGTLERAGIGRVLCVAVHKTAGNQRFFVTGGCSLDLWQIMNREDSETKNYTSRDLHNLSPSAVLPNQEVLSTEEEDNASLTDTNSEFEDSDRDLAGEEYDNEEVSKNNSWCHIL